MNKLITIGKKLIKIVSDTTHSLKDNSPMSVSDLGIMYEDI